MRRSSVLQDYKPRLEWIDPEGAKRKRRKKKTGLILCVSMVGVWTYFSLNADLTQYQSLLSNNDSHESTSQALTLTLQPNPIMGSETTPESPQQLVLSEKGNSTPTKQNTSSTTKTDTVIPFEPLASTVSTQGLKLAPAKASQETTEIELDAFPSAKPDIEESWRTVTVKEGDNLSLIFSRLAINKSDLYQILSIGEETDSLKNLMPGQILKLKFDDDAKIQTLIHESDLTHTLQITRAEESFEAEITKELPDTKVVAHSGTIQDSLFLSGQKAGLSDNVIMQMFDIFGWDIDFVLDIREGDAFRVVYEQLFKNGEYIKDGAILAAEFVNQGKSYKAVRFIDSQDRVAYYTEDGNSMRKAFLRTPVNFTRISSHFNLKRKHPVLNKIRAHKGVDYAAPSGTPVKSTGAGKVVFAGSKNGYGHTVIVEHGGKYTTLYAHLSRFARGLKKGQRVEQGQTIAYVGQSGLATGPHLHYEFRINGKHHNPLTVALPKSLPLPQNDLRLFKEQTKVALAKLEALSSGTQTAKVETPHASEVELAANNKTSHAHGSLN